MEIIETASMMQKRSEELRTQGKQLAFVPTMGFLHEGHLELMRAGRKNADILVVSIFVNPTQFGPTEDLDKYPRDMDGDLEKCKDVGADIVFIPQSDDMYPKGYQTNISVKNISDHLCGLSRPIHFDGVATVVTKLFNITKPHKAIFGEKDFQQLSVIRRMVKDLNMDIEITGIPTVREPDGLAMSSRNSYLSPEERKSALCLIKSLDLAQVMAAGGEKLSSKIITEIKDLIMRHPFTQIDYVNICDPETMEDIDYIENNALLALAVKVGKTRLIDNCILNR
jgi:pantoate--beta-alanine ligase